ncbi:MAG TPA: glycosyltransferase family 2 protein [Vicinamibacterales bacterium]|nr:glycosyltransferase family 2 protein [Vicinamibacterales bacterium]
MTGRGMDLTIVIVNWNGGQLLMRCLKSIRTHAGPTGVSVIVVDNDSKDGSRQAAAEHFPEFRVINSGANLGFGRANNLARNLVTTPLVLFLNPDTELLEGALENAVRCLNEHPDVGALGCRMLEPDGTVQELGLQWPITAWTAFLELLFVTHRSRHRLRRWLPTVDPSHSAYVRKLYGGFLLVRRDVLDAAGWFDERYFMYAEDADLCRTIPALGWKLYYCAESVIVHVGGGVTTGAPSTFSTLMGLESINKMIAKYQGRTAASLHRMAVLAGGLARLGAVLLVGATRAGRRSETSAAQWKASCLKQRQLVLWSLGLRRAPIPVARSHNAD